MSMMKWYSSMHMVLERTDEKIDANFPIKIEDHVNTPMILCCPRTVRKRITPSSDKPGPN